MRTAVVVGVALVSSLAFGAKPQAGRQAAASDPAIRQVADNYVKASLAGDGKAIAALYADDALEMPPNQPTIKGRAAIEGYYTKLMSGGTKMGSFTLTHIESRASGNSGYDVGTYQQSMTPAGATAPVKDSGKYVVILKRTGGAWKVAYAIYNSDQAPPTGR
jgi:uncharacterized protein (TIGR02246 family)